MFYLVVFFLFVCLFYYFGVYSFFVMFVFCASIEFSLFSNFLCMPPIHFSSICFCVSVQPHTCSLLSLVSPVSTNLIYPSLLGSLSLFFCSLAAFSMPCLVFAAATAFIFYPSPSCWFIFLGQTSLKHATKSLHMIKSSCCLFVTLLLKKW